MEQQKSQPKLRLSSGGTDLGGVRDPSRQKAYYWWFAELQAPPNIEVQRLKHVWSLVGSLRLR